MVLAATAMAMFATNLDFFALNLSIPGMARELDVSTTDMQWAISGFMLAIAPTPIPASIVRGMLKRSASLPESGPAIAGLAVASVPARGHQALRAPLRCGHVEPARRARTDPRARRRHDHRQGGRADL
jgi:MFS family permease